MEAFLCHSVQGGGDHLPLLLARTSLDPKKGRSPYQGQCLPAVPKLIRISILVAMASFYRQRK